ncbi:MAG: two-component regulator propeller domain-containing protein, partial [Acidobacteriota bacterium]
MRLSSALLCSAAALLSTIPVGAQQPNLHYYGLDDGLAQGQVLSLAQDSVGYLWFGNYGGLSRYDGSRFETWESGDGLPANTVYHLAPSSDGRLAVTSVGGALCVLHLEEAGRGAVPGADAYLEGAGGLTCRSLGDTIVLSDVTWSRDNSGIWVTSDRGLYRYEPGRGADAAGTLRRFDSADGLPSVKTHSVAFDDRWLWVATDRGLARRRLDGGAGSRFESIPTLDGDEVRAIAVGPRGVFAAIDGGLVLVGRDGAVTPAPLGDVPVSEPQELAVDAEGTAWAATHDGVLSWDGTADGEVRQLDTRRGLKGKVTHALMIDHEGSIWIGSDFGATKLLPGPFETYGGAEGAPNELIRAVAEDDDGHLWIGTRAGVARLVDHRFETVRLPELDDPRIYALTPDRGGMWIGSRSGLIYSRGDELLFLDVDDGLPSAYVSSLAVEPGAGLWIATDGGLAFRD